MTNNGRKSISHDDDATKVIPARPKLEWKNAKLYNISVSVKFIGSERNLPFLPNEEFYLHLKMVSRYSESLGRRMKMCNYNKE